MANKNVFASLKSLLPRADAVNEAGGVAYQHAAQACPGPARGHGLLQRHLLRRCRTSSSPRCCASPRRSTTTVFSRKLAVYSRERAFMKDMPAALLLILSQPRPESVPPCLRARRRQRPRPAHAVPDDPLGPVWPQELVVRAAARVPALAERGQRRATALGVDRQRSEPARRAASGPADADGQRAAGPVRLADRQAGREVGAGDGGRSAGGSRRSGGVPQRRNGRRAGRHARTQPLPLGPAGGQCARPDRVEGDRATDGYAGAAHEPEHAAAS